MTKEQIERRAEAAFDRLDAKFRAGLLTQAEYDADSLAVSDWAERQYRKQIRQAEGW